jgi:phytoene synthase
MDAVAQCAEIVRREDRDRYLADLFAPAAPRSHLFALHAFNSEVARVPATVSQPMLGEIRLQWWHDALHGDAAGAPVAAALQTAIAECRLPLRAFDNLLEARKFDLYDDPMPSLNDLEGYAGETSSALLQLAAIILAGGTDPGTSELSGHAGVAYAFAGILTALPEHTRRRKCYLPGDLVAAHGVSLDDIFAGRTTPPVRALLAELRAITRRHLDAARQRLAATDPKLLPAYLPLALVEPRLRLLERRGFDPLRMPAVMAPWRTHFILWRAARAWTGRSASRRPKTFMSA